jgi:OOP family OmpA-OmpF porin
MNTVKKPLYILFLALAVVSVQACKSRKKLMKNTAPAAEVTTPPTTPQPKPASAPEQPAPEPPKPDYNFQNIQFEFNSSVLKTEAYPILDKASTAMRADQTKNFAVNGYASSEGTAAYNMQLSIDRANSVRAYLINSGVKERQLRVKGYGETHPIATNDTEEGRILNRRVEIKKLN